MLEEISQALSIKFNRSEDGQSFDIPISPSKQGFPQKVKCFKCYGTSKEKCLECHGSHMITGNHPLAKLLNDILLKKMNLSKSHSEEEDLEKVYPIKQEEQDGEDKKLLCFYCSVQCELACYYCRKCPQFSVCSQCYSKSIDHQHELEENVRFSSCKVLNAEVKCCKNCESKIEDCYTICRTCQTRDINYWICDSCSDNNIFQHPKDHIFQPMIEYDQNKQKRIQVLSQTFTEEDQEHSITYNDFLQPIELIERPLNVNYCQSEAANLIGSLQLHRNNSHCSSIQFDMESSLFNSHEIGTQLKSILRTKSKCSVQVQVNKRAKFSVFTLNSQQKQNRHARFQQPIQHIFLDYRCDSCHSQKIVNVRYHCRMCQDYDLCEICYYSDIFQHEHEHFDKIDGRVIKQNALKRIIGKERDSSILYTRNSTCMSKSQRPPLQSLLNTYL